MYCIKQSNNLCVCYFSASSDFYEFISASGESLIGFPPCFFFNKESPVFHDSSVDFLSLNKLQKVYEEKHKGFLFGKILMVETNKLSIKIKKTKTIQNSDICLDKNTDISLRKGTEKISTQKKQNKCTHAHIRVRTKCFPIWC